MRLGERKAQPRELRLCLRLGGMVRVFLFGCGRLHPLELCARGLTLCCGSGTRALLVREQALSSLQLCQRGCKLRFLCLQVLVGRGVRRRRRFADDDVIRVHEFRLGRWTRDLHALELRERLLMRALLLGQRALQALDLGETGLPFGVCRRCRRRGLDALQLLERLVAFGSNGDELLFPFGEGRLQRFELPRGGRSSGFADDDVVCVRALRLRRRGRSLRAL